MSRLSSLSSLLVASLFVAAASACQTTPSEVEPAPMGEAGQKKLRNALIGTWRKTEGLAAATGNAGGGGGQESDGPIVVWTFDQDGTGAKTIRPSAEAEGTEQTFQWHLEGRNIVIKYDDGSKANYFRAETWSPAQMQWYRYTTDQSYMVKKYGGAERKPQRERQPKQKPSGLTPQ
ncbi:MAG: lipocalin family protein [Bradymonadaceae bacterium]